MFLLFSICFPNEILSWIPYCQQHFILPTTQASNQGKSIPFLWHLWWKCCPSLWIPCPTHLHLHTGSGPAALSPGSLRHLPGFLGSPLLWVLHDVVFNTITISEPSVGLHYFLRYKLPTLAQPSIRWPQTSHCSQKPLVTFLNHLQCYELSFLCVEGQLLPLLEIPLPLPSLPTGNYIHPSRPNINSYQSHAGFSSLLPASPQWISSAFLPHNFMHSKLY